MKNIIIKAKFKCAVIKNGYNKKVKAIKEDCKKRKELAKKNIVDAICNG